MDSDVKRGKEIAGLYDCDHYSKIENLPEEVDFAVIAVPTVLHRDCAAPFLHAGKACLIEKPMAPDVETCEAILADAEAGGAMVGVGHVERFNPAVRRAQELGIQPRFIEAHRLAPYSFRSVDVGVVLDLMIHDAVGGSTLSPSEDIVSARLHFENGVVANLTASRLSLKPMRRFRFFGPDSYVSIDSQDRYSLLVKKSKGFGPEKIEAAAKSGNPMEGFQSLLEIEELQLEESEPLRAELEAFVDAVRSGSRHEVSGHDGRDNVKVAYQVLDGLKNTGW